MGTHDEDEAEVLRAIDKCLDEPGMVTAFVLIAAYVAADGERKVYSVGLKNQLAAETIGLLVWMEEYQRYEMHKHMED